MNDNLLIINDEAHISTATKLINQLPNALLLGFTATPDWNAAKHLPEIYKACVVGAQVHDLIQLGYLTPNKYYARVGADLDALKLKNGQFTEESQEQAFETKGVFNGLIEDLRTISYRKCMIFCASIKHCRDVLADLEFNGFKAIEYHSKTDNRDYNLFLFEGSGIDICVSCGSLTKGYDNWQVDLICIVRAISSLPLFCQINGRGSRIVPTKFIADHTKNFFITIDYGANYKRFGLWDFDRPWSEMWLPQKKQKKNDTLGVAPVKMCEECMAIIPVSAIVCPYCSALIPGKEKEMEEGELVEITEEYDKLRGKRISELMPDELALFAKLKNKRAWCIRVAKAKEQSGEVGYLHSFADAMNYKKGWMHHQTIETEKIEFYDTVLK